MLFKSSLVFLWSCSLVSLGVSQKCTGQSCAIAALSGSTKESFEEIVESGPTKGKQPQGSNSSGKACITRYYKQLGLKAPKGFKKRGFRDIIPPDAARDVLTSPPEVQVVSNGPSSELESRQGCKQNYLVFARGTTEPGTMGTTVGPALSAALGRVGGSWGSWGVSYSADIAGDNCIGFPGGMKCVDQLAKHAAKCPESKYFVGGYSQGAMVARICVAFSKDDVKARIKGVVVYGDPFNGASIKGFPQERIKTYCAAGDGVCQGKFVITPAHLSYTAGAGISGAAKWMAEQSKT